MTQTDYIHQGDFDFEQLRALLLKQKYADAGINIKKLAQQIKMSDFALEAGDYSRNIISDDLGFWLGVIRWDKGVKTAIHGHPKHSFFYVLEGELLCRNFQNDPLKSTGSKSFKQYDYCYFDGIEGKMDNLIHQITAQKPSLSLHFYSAHPSKGETFDC